MGRFTGILGLLTMLGLAYIFSTNRRAIRVKTVAWGLGLQIVFAIFVLRVDYGRRAFQVAGDAANRVLELRLRRFGIRLRGPGQAGFAASALSSRFRCCPPSSSSARFSRFSITTELCSSSSGSRPGSMTRIMGASGAESLNVAASIFMGQTEAPVTIRPFLPDLTRSELMTVMTSGMAHVSG